jgi:multidrug resistance protein MdtO
MVSAAAALERQPRIVTDDERRRLARLADRCAEVRQALTTDVVPTSLEGSDGLAHGDGASPASPMLAELTHALDLIGQAFHEGSGAASPAPSSAGRLFVPDALTNPEYVRYALKGALAVLICYVLQCAVDWPGIRTCIITCLIVALGSEGATIQKATLRISGALVGAALGFLAILFLVPSMESITSLVLVVAAGTVVAGWVVVGSPRIAYAGVQLAFAFYVCVIQGFEPSWHFDTIRDRLIGILLGNTVITLVFVVRVAVGGFGGDVDETRFGAPRDGAARHGARSRRRCSSPGHGHRRSPGASRARLHDRAAAGRSSRVRAQRRARRSRTIANGVADAQSVLLTQLAIVAQPAPDVRSFDRAVAERLSAIAEDAESRGRRTGPVAPIALSPSNDGAALYRELAPASSGSRRRRR